MGRGEEEEEKGGKKKRVDISLLYMFGLDSPLARRISTKMLYQYRQNSYKQPCILYFIELSQHYEKEEKMTTS